MNISIIWDNIIRKKMKVIINGQDKILEDNLSLKEIIQNLNIEDKVMACAVNMDIVKKESWSSYIPKKITTQ